MPQNTASDQRFKLFATHPTMFRHINREQNAVGQILEVWSRDKENFFYIFKGDNSMKVV